MRFEEKQWLWTKTKTDLQKTFSSPLHKNNVIDMPCMAEPNFISNIPLKVRQTSGYPHLSKPKHFFIGN